MVSRVFELQHVEQPDEETPNEVSSELHRLLQARAHGERATPRGEDFVAPRVGQIVAVDTDEIRVLFAGAAQATPARLACAASLEQLERACLAQQEVLLVFENADPTRPLITGLISAPTRELRAEAPSVKLPEGLVIDADADGQRLRLSARDEIVFQCGEASVTLTSSGRVIVRGTYVETYARGVNRIKGGQVRIN